jgi:hypothetical protein
MKTYLAQVNRDIESVRDLVDKADVAFQDDRRFESLIGALNRLAAIVEQLAETTLPQHELPF